MKVQFNCRLEELVAEWIATEAMLKSVELKRRISQADVIEMLVGQVDAAAVPERDWKPKKVSKLEQVVRQRAEGDLSARLVGRDDVDYSDVESGPSTHILDAVGVGLREPKGKISVAEWRAGRKPLMKPGEKKVKE